MSDNMEDNFDNSMEDSVEDIWETFAEVSNQQCLSGNIGKTKFDCCADWEFSVKRAPKTEKNREVIESMLKGKLRIEKPSLMKVFEESCWVNKIEFLDDFEKLNNIGQIWWYERIRNDGNCIQGIFEDEGSYYMIWFCGS